MRTLAALAFCCGNLADAHEVRKEVLKAFSISELGLGLEDGAKLQTWKHVELQETALRSRWFGLRQFNNITRSRLRGIG